MDIIRGVPVVVLWLWASLVICSAGHAREPVAGPCENHLNYSTGSAGSMLTKISNQQDNIQDGAQFDQNSDTEWRFRYMDEQADRSEVLVREESIDQRLANVIYTSSMVRIFDTAFVVFNSGDPAEDEANQQLVGSSPMVDDELCGQHLSEMLQQMQDLEQQLERKRSEPQLALNLTDEHYLLARVLDSFGRYDSGHLLGRNQAPGSFVECIGSHLLLSSSSSSTEKVKTRFCWARLKLDKHLHPSLKNRVVDKLEPKDHLIQTAICIPQTCHSKSFKRHEPLFRQVATSQFKLPRAIYLDEELELESIYCVNSPGESSSLGVPLIGKLWICFVVLWLTVAMYTTLFIADTPTKAAHRRETSNQSVWSRLVGCLDLRQSWADLVESGNNSGRRIGRVNLDVLNPIKLLGTLVVVLGHSLIFELVSDQTVLKVAGRIETEPGLLLIVISIVVVDSFSVITGIFLSYVTLSKANSSSSSTTTTTTTTTTTKTPSPTSSTSSFFSSWLQIALTRYLRLLPMFYLMFWFHKGVFIHLNAHLAYTDTGFNQDTIIGACKRESWLSPLVWTSAFRPMGRQCLPQTWSVSADLFYALFLTPIFMLFIKRGRLAVVVSVLLCSLSVGLAHRAFYQVNEHTREHLLEARAHGMAKMFNQASHLYTSPHLRVSPILLGAILGYYLFRYKLADDEEPRRADRIKPGSHAPIREWPQWLKGPATWGSLVFVLSVFIVWPQLALIKQVAAPYHRLIIPSTLSTLRFMWALTNGILFLRMATDWRHTWPMVQSSSRLWRVMAKLCYSILLVHASCLLLHRSYASSFGSLSLFKLMVTFISVYVASLLAAVFMYVVFENPIDKVVRRIIQPMMYGM